MRILTVICILIFVGLVLWLDEMLLRVSLLCVMGILILAWFAFWLDNKLFRCVWTKVPRHRISVYVEHAVGNGLDGSCTFIFQRESGRMIVVRKSLTPNARVDGTVEVTVEARSTAPMQLRHHFSIRLPQIWRERVIKVPRMQLPTGDCGSLLSQVKCGASMRAVNEAVAQAVSGSFAEDHEIRFDIWSVRLAGGHKIWGRFDDI